MAPGFRSQCHWLAAVLVVLQAVGVTAVGEVVSVRALLEEIVDEALEKHCPSAEQEASRELRMISNTRTALKEVLAETMQESHRILGQDPDWRCSCLAGFIPCAGRCYARLHRPVVYEQAERECAALGGHLAVPRSREQNLCVAGLAGQKHVWLGVTDREQEGVFAAADGRPVTGSEGHSWSPGQPDNHAGKEHCVEIWPARAGVRFADWNDYPCTMTTVYPMCQLP